MKGEDTINSYIIQGISNVDTMKGSHLEKRMIDKFSLNYRSFLEKVYQWTTWEEIYYYLKNNINDWVLVCIYGIGAFYVIQEELTLSSLIVYQTFFSYFSTCFNHILAVIEEYNSYKISLDRVEELFMIEEDNFQNNYFYLPYQLDGDIRIKNLNYTIGSKVLLPEKYYKQ